MIPFFEPKVLTQQEIQGIHEAMVCILSRTGCLVENEEILQALEGYGAKVNRQERRARFPAPTIERFLHESEPAEPRCSPQVSCGVGIYQGSYLSPNTGEHVPFTAKTLADYIKLARLLRHVDGVGMLNCPVSAASPTEPMEARLFAWKHGAGAGTGIQRLDLCPYLLEMCEIKAQADGKRLQDVFSGAVYMLSPLRIPEQEAGQMMYFKERGLRVSLSNQITIGGTGPVTIAGSLALNLAEKIVIGTIHRVLYGARRWSVGGGSAPLDMRTMIQPYGRPEMLLSNLANMQLARHYRVHGGAHCGNSDAKAPSCEASMQKVLSAMPCILAGGGNIGAGLLSIDELFSPIQMILDNELAGALRRVVRGFEVNADTLATDVIDQVGPGGFFTASEHSAAHFRNELWEPEIWSRESLQTWLRGERKIDADIALDIWHDHMSKPDFAPGISEDTERRLTDVIKRARGAIA